MVGGTADSTRHTTTSATDAWRDLAVWPWEAQQKEEAGGLGDDQDEDTKQEPEEQETDDKMKAGEDNVLMEPTIVARARMQHLKRHTRASQQCFRTKVMARVKVSPRAVREVGTAGTRLSLGRRMDGTETGRVHRNLQDWRRSSTKVMRAGALDVQSAEEDLSSQNALCCCSSPRSHASHSSSHRDLVFVDELFPLAAGCLPLASSPPLGESNSLPSPSLAPSFGS